MTAVIQFDSLNGSSTAPAGIDVATREFLRAYVRYGSQERLQIVCPTKEVYSEFTTFVAGTGGDPAACARVDADDADAIADAGCFVRYDPAIADLAWARRAHGQRRWSLCGIAHTSSTNSAMDLAGALVTAPTQSWDALICPSQAIRDALKYVVDGWCNYLGKRLDARAACPVQFPVIPLGVDAPRFGRLADPKSRSGGRAALGVASNEDVVVLFHGRLSHYTKANPLQLMLAAEAVAKDLDRALHLVFFGYFADDTVERAFRETAAGICHACRVHFVANNDSRFPDGAWAAADIFCSLPDNVQESFGLTPIEAMAAGLPVVASDWDGYRDTVRDGVDGICVPTAMPPPGAGGELAFRYFTGIDNYGEYLGTAQQSISVDADGLAGALARLAESPDLRRKMGASGREHAAATFDWPHIIRAYEELWADLAERRRSDEESAPAQAAGAFHPLRPDPFAMFEGFATAALADGGRLTVAVTKPSDAVRRMSQRVSLFSPWAVLSHDELLPIIGEIEAQGSVSVGDVIAAFPEVNRSEMLRTLGWLVKLGICRYRPATK